MHWFVYLSLSLGSYSDSLGSTNCTQCPANYYCTSTTKTACSPGSYSLIGSSSCEPCPGGYECPGSGSDPVICVAGTYAMNGSHNCTECDEGYSCPVDGMSEQQVLWDRCEIYYLIMCGGGNSDGIYFLAKC